MCVILVGGGVVGTLMDGVCAPLLGGPVQNLPVVQNRRRKSGRSGLSGDRKKRLKETRSPGGGSKLVRRSLLKARMKFCQWKVGSGSIWTRSQPQNSPSLCGGAGRRGCAAERRSRPCPPAAPRRISPRRPRSRPRPPESGQRSWDLWAGPEPPCDSLRTPPGQEADTDAVKPRNPNVWTWIRSSPPGRCTSGSEDRGWVWTGWWSSPPPGPACRAGRLRRCRAALPLRRQSGCQSAASDQRAKNERWGGGVHLWWQPCGFLHRTRGIPGPSWSVRPAEEAAPRRWTSRGRADRTDPIRTSRRRHLEARNAPEISRPATSFMSILHMLCLNLPLGGANQHSSSTWEADVNRGSRLIRSQTRKDEADISAKMLSAPGQPRSPEPHC